ncbi:tRNA glutamyl-Q(34) synthetase GluQRS [Aquamicrobium zhengzhouense]|uniref:tRNA glutamyl-Q(34) synthetase GluQRS n=1 Tax=Aquamicrobium zhengzhouense TaxID=2781738 RepID=A0ABS0SDY8_9HYPH|nr:tRNA glutamyl-Q(34) synthetase GluQRS [Aquamicrobium zhengzhouense]MBI1621466.1 tRNA glutamyl-Q(34) synthetase GluQRS [Aquamicrobium zhengzhouense]
MTRPVFRFAPSPNGELHLGHAYSALLNDRMAKEADGRLLLRIEDIDVTRCTRDFEQAIYRDLNWLEVGWEEPVRHQSEHFEDYAGALESLADAGLVYPSFMSRGEVRAIITEAEEAGRDWPRDPDGVPLFPSTERNLSDRERKRRIADGEPFAWRINVDEAMRHAGQTLFWIEGGAGPKGETGEIPATPRAWGDVVIARKEVPTSYHLSVVIDDALQGITHVVRGKDLFQATALQRLLQELLGLNAPVYFHHDLVLGEDGHKLSKSRRDTGLNSLREAGLTPSDIKRMVGLA